MAAWDLRETEGQMFGMSKSGIPGREALIERHLRGTDVNGAPFVMGVYPMRGADQGYQLPTSSCI
jgi:hypothetical protein